MFEDDSNPKEGGQKKPSGNAFNKIPVFTLLAWAGIIASAVVLFMMKQHATVPAVILSQSEFLNKFQSNQIAHASSVRTEKPTGWPLTRRRRFSHPTNSIYFSLLARWSRVLPMLRL